MYDIPELEKKWRKYKFNQIKKPLIIGVGALILIGGASILVSTYSSDKKESKQVVTNTQPATKQQNNAIIITKTPANAPQNSQVVAQQNQNPLIAAKPTSETIQQSDPEESIDLSNAKIVTPNLPKDEIRVIGFDDNKAKNKKNTPQNDIVIPKKSVQEIQDQEKIAEIEERFKATQDPKDSLYIAKYYYKKRNYKKAETWAINTNNIDGDIEESWIIFAKARAKQGFRVDAIKVLQSYYDETRSPKAKELLDKLRFGKPID